MPQNTPVIYIVGALIALGGVLFGAIGQIVSSSLQRRHERRLKLYDVRRETYAAMYRILQESATVIADHKAIRTSLEALTSRGEEVTQSMVDDVTRRLERAGEQRDGVQQRRDETSAMLMLVASPSVQKELHKVLQKLLSIEGPLGPHDRDPFLNACRRELGVKGDAP